MPPSSVLMLNKSVSPVAGAAGATPPAHSIEVGHVRSRSAALRIAMYISVPPKFVVGVKTADNLS